MEEVFVMKNISKLVAAYVVAGCLATTMSAQQSDTLQFTLQQITVRENFPDERYSPLRIERIDRDEIDRRSLGATFPELLGGTAGVYATAETGSYGDARLNIRGFKQENIAVMLNGIPISGLTSSSMYWNNWLGLTDATYAVQLQKGVGGSWLADNSVGGTVNIVTLQPDRLDGGTAGITMTNYGLMKFYGSAASGTLASGWSLAANLSYTWGNNYVQATPVSVMAYMVSASKRFDSRNTLLLTALGSPERHGQRSQRLSADEVERYGVRYNKDWGLRGGRRFNLSLNNYFKPYFTAQHIFDNGATKISTSAYLAIASGGGRWNESKGAALTTFRGDDGQIDFASVESLNAASEGSVVVLSDYIAGHLQTGLLSKQEFRLSPHLRLETGAHYQYYSTHEREELTDLLGGDYWYEAWGANHQKQLGEGIRTLNGKEVHHATIYGSLNYRRGGLSLTAGVSLLHAEARRWDRYNYADDIWSRWARGTGYTAKAGILWRATPHSTFYANAAAYSRVPYTGVWFSSGSNAINRGVENEQNRIAEAGYRLWFERGSIEITGYYALWHNKSILSNRYIPTDGDTYKFMITGLDARHAGVEVDGRWRITKQLEVALSASLADWRWLNDVDATVYDPYTEQPAATVNVYCRNLPVGDAPQTQAILKLDYRPTEDWYAAIEANYSRRLYADFEPSSRSNPDDRALPYRLPDRVVVNARGGWRWFSVGVDNLFDLKYIERGLDGADHSLATFRGYWGFGRTFNFAVRLAF